MLRRRKNAPLPLDNRRLLWHSVSVGFTFNVVLGKTCLDFGQESTNVKVDGVVEVDGVRKLLHPALFPMEFGRTPSGM